MKNIILYSTDCPKCKILEQKLDTKNVSYTKCKDIDLMQSKGFQEAPKLEVDGEVMSFGEAVKWVNNNL